MQEFSTLLVSYATTRNLIGILVDPVLILVLYGIFRAVGLRILRALPRKGFFSSWAKDVEGLFKRLLALGVALALVTDLGLSVWLIRKGQDPINAKLAFIEQVYEQHRAAILLGFLAVLGAIVLNLIVLQIVGKLLNAISKWAQGIDSVKGNDEAVAASFEVLRWGIERASWFLLLAYGASKLPFLPEIVPAFLYVGLRVFVVYAIARLAWSSLDIIVTTLDGIAKNAAEKREVLRYYEVAKPLFPTLRRALEATILVVGASFAVAQVQAFESLSGFGVAGMKVVGLLFTAQVLSTLFEFLMRELLINRGQMEPEERQRRLTLIPLISSIARYVIFGFGIVMSLAQVGIDPLPLLAGAGVAGVAVGFGAQSLITDLVSGIFILWENYFIVGDYVAIGEQEGIVEAISLRVTRLRDEEGRVHIIPNGKIEGITNYSKEWVSAEIGVGVSYEMNLDKVYEALDEVSDWARENVSDVIARPEIEGVEDFADSAVIVKLSAKVKPGTHLTTGRLLRKRIKEVFDSRGIEIAYPRRVIYVHSEGSREFMNDLGETLGGKKLGARKSAAS